MDPVQAKNITQDCTTLMVCKSSLSLIGMVYYSMKKIWCDTEYYGKKMGGPAFTGGYTNGEKIVYLVNEETTSENLIFTTVHEILHVIDFHIIRRGERNPFLWNLACDHVVNKLAIELDNHTSLLGNLRSNRDLYKYVLFDDIVDDEKYKTPEEVYEYLLEEQKNFKYSIKKFDKDGQLKDTGNRLKRFPNDNEPGIEYHPDKDEFKDDPPNSKEPGKESDGDTSGSGESGGGKSKKQSGDETKGSGSTGKSDGKQDEPSENDDGSGNDGSGDNYDPKELEGLEVVEVLDKKTGKKYYSPIDTDPNSQVGSEDISPSEKFEHFKSIKDNTRSNWKNSTARGTMPGSMVDFLDSAFKVELPWDELLKDAILYKVSSRTDKTWLIPDQIIRPVPSYRKGRSTSKYSPRIKGRSGKPSPFTLVAAIDSSGSVDKDSLRSFVGVLCGSVNYFKKIHVYIHDVNVVDEIVIDKPRSEEDVYNRFANGIKGRGGTSHEDVFDKIELLNNDEKVSSVIFLTDYESDVQSLYKKYEFMNTHETIWVLNNERYEVQLDVKTRTIHIK